jgi:hypothetical protein
MMMQNCIGVSSSLVLVGCGLRAVSDGAPSNLDGFLETPVVKASLLDSLSRAAEHDERDLVAAEVAPVAKFIVIVPPRIFARDSDGLATERTATPRIRTARGSA